MISDYKIIHHEFDRQAGITIIPVCDVHLGAAECDEEAFRGFINAVATMPNTYLVLGGDLINNGLRGSVGNPFDEKYRPGYQKQLMSEILEPVKDKILAAVGGNHEARSRKDSDTDITLDIMSKLNIEHLYRPNIAFVHIGFNKGAATHNHRINYCLALTHGTGGGTLTGGSVNRNERFISCFDGIDAFITGHTHKTAVTTPVKVKVDPAADTVKFLPVKVITATSWLKYGGYALNKMLLPAAHQLQMILLDGKRKEITVTA